MKNVLIYGGAAVGVYLLWRYCTKPVAAEDATAAAPSAAASSMTYSGASNTLVGGNVHTKGLLNELPVMLRGVSGAASNLAALVRRDAQTIAGQTARADARMEVAPPAPASTGIPILGRFPVLGTLPAFDHGGTYVPGFPGTMPGSNLK
jgi:hypothetical protein